MTAPNLEEYATYLEGRIEELQDVLLKCGDAINNLDARLLMVERLVAKIRHDMDGKLYEESKLRWWN